MITTSKVNTHWFMNPITINRADPNIPKVVKEIAFSIAALICGLVTVLLPVLWLLSFMPNAELRRAADKI